ncbi:hypothetical protein E5161_09355 [Cohnella pontilimi]|uniref:Uncharacterized protein n=1 Tax=Cohnella pontilimi TaxID=2564100 RepID=A0A4U0FBJ4_9BACL|nr:DUF6220 domain-containing protein [Cohnella pontilimi]TJY42206.1 hypothetical protein E5161_09355 [Cohnella pontilimi]
MEKNIGRIRFVRFLYGLLATGYLVCVILQVFFAGLGILADPNGMQLHRVFANYFEFASVIMFVLTFFGRIRGSLRWLPLVMFGITALQHITIQQFSGDLRAIHVVDALALFAISMHLAKRSWSWLLLREKDIPSTFTL